MKPPLIIVGAGLAGATIAALLKNEFSISVYEKKDYIGGLLYDKDGIQHFGPHAFHTNNEDVWKFVNQFAEFRPYDLKVYSYSEPRAIIELPQRPEDDIIFKTYSEKAWGIPFNDLPPSIKERVPRICTDSRVGYHNGTFKGQPMNGYSSMIESMLYGVDIHVGCSLREDIENIPIFWTGDINDYTNKHFDWIGRQWIFSQGKLPYPVVNYSTHAVPQIRSYDCQKINPYFHKPGVVSEFKSDNIPCYPYPSLLIQQQAQNVVENAKDRNHWLCGRLGTYQYLDMDKTILNVFDTVSEFKSSL